MAVRAGRVYSSYLAHVVEGGVRCAADYSQAGFRLSLPIPT